jgi:hypothetical protein
VSTRVLFSCRFCNLIINNVFENFSIVLRKSSTLGLDELNHASVGPASELEKESNVGALIDMPGNATIIQSSVPKETLALSITSLGHFKC